MTGGGADPSGVDMISLSQLLRRTLVDGEGRARGHVRDVVVHLGGTDYPVVVGLIADIGGRTTFVPEGCVELGGPHHLALRPSPTDARGPADDRGAGRRDGEVLLREDVLGHRLVDIARARLVRAYDVQLAARGGGWVVYGVGTRRPAWWSPRRGEQNAFRDWRAFEALIGHRPTVLVRSSFGRLRRLRAAQLADLLEDASRDEQAEILAQVRADPELEADVYEELDDHRGALLAARTDRDIADVLARMRTDDAADALSDLPQHRRASVLRLLPDGHRAAVRDLLTYNETTAGGLMGLEFLAIPAGLTAGEALGVVRAARQAPPEAAVTVHLVTGADHLIGVVAVVRLVQADPATPVTALADLDPVRVVPQADLADLTVLMADHNLPTLPVVDAADRLLGVITVDDVLAATIPSGWRDREPPTRPTAEAEPAVPPEGRARPE